MTKRILITGAGSGFGKGAGLQLARSGHEVIATTQVSSQKMDLLAEANSEGLNMRVEVMDITNAEDREVMFENEIDILVSNAGIMEAGPVSGIPMEHVRKNYEVNVFGILAVIQDFAP